MKVRPSSQLIGLILVAGLALSGATAATGQAGRAATDQNEWDIDSLNSTASFAVKHMLVTTVRGQLGPVSGKVWFDGKDVSSIRADATIDVKKLTTGNETRDNHLRTDDFFDVPHYPTITFKSKRVVPGEAGHFGLVGDLRIRSTTKEVTLNVEGPAPVIKAQNVFRTGASGTLKLNRFDYGLRWNDLIEIGGSAMVAAEVTVTIDLEVMRKSSHFPGLLSK